MPGKFAELGGRALVRVAGPDWRVFLQGLLSNDVTALEPGAVRFAALLTPQGRLLFDLFVWAREEGCLLDVERDRREALVQRLSLYRLRAMVEITAQEGRVCAFWGAEHAPEGWTPDPRLHQLGFRGLDLEPPPGAEVAGEAAYDAFRLDLGIPDPARDAEPDKTYPIEADFDLLNGIDFKKGCFVGQETTSRMKRRGGVRSRMLPIRFEGPPPPFGAEIMAAGLRAGQVLSARDGRAIALLRLDRIEAGGLTVDGRPVTVLRPSWLD